MELRRIVHHNHLDSDHFLEEKQKKGGGQVLERTNPQRKQGEERDDLVPGRKSLLDAGKGGQYLK